MDVKVQLGANHQTPHGKDPVVFRLVVTGEDGKGRSKNCFFNMLIYGGFKDMVNFLNVMNDVFQKNSKMFMA